MAETNGSGRMDRIEASLETTGRRLNELTEKFHLMVDHHEAEFKQLMTWQVRTQDKMDAERAEAARERKRLDQLNETTDKRIADLVVAIAELIQKRG